MSRLEADSAVRTEFAEPQLEDGGHDRFSHYARKADILESTVTGRPIVALCGKVWTPSRDPDRYPICPHCKEFYEKKRLSEGGD